MLANGTSELLAINSELQSAIRVLSSPPAVEQIAQHATLVTL
jgi:hypothetical protein